MANHRLVATAVRDEDDASEEPVDEREDEVHVEVLLVLGHCPGDEGGKGQADAKEQSAEHPLGGVQLALIGV